MSGGGEVQWSCTVASLTGARRRCLPQCPSRYATVAGVHGPIVTHLYFNLTHGTFSSQHHSLLASSLFQIHALLHNYRLSSRCAVFNYVSRCVELASPRANVSRRNPRSKELCRVNIGAAPFYSSCIRHVFSVLISPFVLGEDLFRVNLQPLFLRTLHLAKSFEVARRSAAALFKFVQRLAIVSSELQYRHQSGRTRCVEEGDIVRVGKIKPQLKVL
jgi:hypothetical protein